MDDQDLALFSRVRMKNDQTAFDELFRKYYTPLCRFARLILKDEALAEEAVQETFIKLWENRKSIRIERAFASFIYSSVRNRALNSLEKLKTRMKYETVFAAENLSGSNDESSDDERTMALVNEAIALLPDKCRKIFKLSRFEGLLYDEIAEYLKVSRKTVENQMTIAFQKLRQYINDSKALPSQKRRFLKMLCF